MVGATVRKGTWADANGFLNLVNALAKFEHLEPPSDSGRKHLVKDIFQKNRATLMLAEDAGKLVGYALYFYNYSSFVAKPTLYLEDLFVLKEYRKRGIGFELFRRCVEEAKRHRCGRMEWAVLTWNRKARSFYERLGAVRQDEWHVYRLDERALGRIPKKLAKGGMA
jgi:GNAT superfamily N-acetyltransferase